MRGAAMPRWGPQANYRQLQFELPTRFVRNKAAGCAHGLPSTQQHIELEQAWAANSIHNALGGSSMRSTLMALLCRRKSSPSPWSGPSQVSLNEDALRVQNFKRVTNFGPEVPGQSSCSLSGPVTDRSCTTLYSLHAARTSLVTASESESDLHPPL